MISTRNYILANEVQNLKEKKKEVKNSKGTKSEEYTQVLALYKEKKKALNKAEGSALFAEVRRHQFIYIMLVIPLIYYFIFKYIPIWNGQIAFRDFVSLKRTGITGGKWVGLQNFKTFINSIYFWDLMRNTLMYSFGKLLVSLPMSIILSIAIYECTRKALRKVVQTLSYLPHFLSWVIMYGILLAILSPSEGIVNDIIKLFGGTSKSFLTDTKAFPFIVILSDAWKEMGWSAIIFIAALMGIDSSLFEAAVVEGANSWQRVRYITLPSIKPVVVIVLLMKIGTILDAGFNQLYMLYSPAVYSVGDIIDTWVYRGTIEGKFSLATAAGLFKGVIGMTLLFVSNWASKKYTDNSLF
ncbi:MAG: ABC transporter permease subunit [Sphaerochaetaceae bacterium]|nr:ABC transporter permease subunit [Sphaerochaetaceae bacterium]